MTIHKYSTCIKILILLSLVGIITSGYAQNEWVIKSYGYNSPSWIYNGYVSGAFPVFNIYGPANYSFGWGYTTYTKQFDSFSTIVFDWSYSSSISTGINTGGYLVNETFSQISGTHQSVDILPGDTFGWYVYTDHSFDSRGVLSVSALELPEPSTYALLCIGAIAVLIVIRRKGDCLAHNKTVKTLTLLLLSFVGILVSAPTAGAVFVDNKLAGYAGGRIGDQSFSYAAFVVSSAADASSIVSSRGSFTLMGLTTTIQIDGIGTAYLTGDSFGFRSLYVNPDFQLLQFQDLSTGNSIFEVSLMHQPAYPDLSTPISGTGGLIVYDGHGSPFLGDGIYSTTLGNLEFNSAYGNYSPTASFTTEVLPEPSTYALLALGAGVLMWARRRQLHRKISTF
jgi:PEP-CTERM motif